MPWILYILLFTYVKISGLETHTLNHTLKHILTHTLKQ